VAAVVTAGAAAGLTDGDVLARMAAEGVAPAFWSAPAGERFGWHEHPADKVLYVVAGVLTFELRDGSVLRLSAGDRIDLEAGTDHAASAGSDGCRCIEGFRGGSDA
jgi:quercetin dioxygenase-like cupin family protein